MVLFFSVSIAIYMVVCRDVCSALFDPHESINAVLIEIISLLKDVREKKYQKCTL